MNSRNKKLVLIGIRRKGENRFKIRTGAKQKVESTGVLSSGKTTGIAAAR